MDILIENLGFAICKTVYPLIVNLYVMFENLSTFSFLTNDYIHSIWNNIYVFVGVIVLFAIAIKLISTIVNPDTLSDNKKGVKAIYFRTVTVVVLIFIIPFLFDYSFTLQQKLVNSNFLISRVFGYKISDKTQVGQLLSFTTFNSFCTLASDSDPSTDPYLMGRVEEHITKDNLNILFEKASLDFHPILCSLSGILVAYELFLLCMDTLFRAAKLSFLEIMLPIVLGAYVFNADILKKWAKEFISTYVSLFFKLLAVAFMIITFSAIKEKVEGTRLFDDDVTQGLFYLLFIIALLQLVKKLPDIINMIFGTHIKDQGGIKGRLGEMAGIGGIAQKAWTSLGTGVKNAAKLGLQAPIGLAYLGADAWYHSKKGERLKNNAAFRTAKGIIYGGRAGLKSGSLLDAYEGYEKSSALSALSKSDVQFATKKARDSYRRFGVNDGYYDNTDKDQASGFKTKERIDSDAKGVLSTSNNSFGHSSMGKKMQANLEAQDSAEKKANMAEGIKLAKDKIESDFFSGVRTELANGKYTAEERAQANDIIHRFNKNEGLISKNDAKVLRRYMDSSTAKDFAKAIQKYDRNVMNYAREYHDDYNLDTDKLAEKLRNSVSLGDIVKNEQQTVESIKKSGQALREDAKTTEVEKINYDIASNAISQIRSKTWGAIQNDQGLDLSDNFEWTKDVDTFASEGTLDKQQKQQPQSEKSIIVGKDGKPLERTAPAPETTVTPVEATDGGSGETIVTPAETTGEGSGGKPITSAEKTGEGSEEKPIPSTSDAGTDSDYESKLRRFDELDRIPNRTYSENAEYLKLKAELDRK